MDVHFHAVNRGGVELLGRSVFEGCRARAAGLVSHMERGAIANGDDILIIRAGDGRPGGLSEGIWRSPISRKRWRAKCQHPCRDGLLLQIQ